MVITFRYVSPMWHWEMHNPNAGTWATGTADSFKSAFRAAGSTIPAEMKEEKNEEREAPP